MARGLVSDIMTRDPITIKPHSSLLDCDQKNGAKKSWVPFTYRRG